MTFTPSIFISILFTALSLVVSYLKPTFLNSIVQSLVSKLGKCASFLIVIGLSITMLICALIVRFSYFANTEIEHFYNPVFDLVRNCSSFILNSSNYAFSYKPILIMTSYSLISLILIIFLLNRFINKQYER